jgi:hypothetical protein
MKKHFIAMGNTDFAEAKAKAKEYMSNFEIEMARRSRRPAGRAISNADQVSLTHCGTRPSDEDELLPWEARGAHPNNHRVPTGIRNQNHPTMYVGRYEAPAEAAAGIGAGGGAAALADALARREAERGAAARRNALDVRLARAREQQPRHLAHHVERGGKSLGRRLLVSRGEKRRRLGSILRLARGARRVRRRLDREAPFFFLSRVQQWNGLWAVVHGSWQ